MLDDPFLFKAPSASDTDITSVLLIDVRENIFEDYRGVALKQSNPINLEVTIDYDVAFQALTANLYDVYILNYQVGGKSGLELLGKAKLYGCEKPVIMMGRGHDNIEQNAVLHGAVNYIDKNQVSSDVLFGSIQHAKYQYDEGKRLHSENMYQQKELNELRTRTKSIIDSISYARHIQDSLLVDRPYIYNLFGEFLIIYKPKDIVSGDFYYAAKKGNKKYIAVADCTGHGVPGAFMSILCNELLKQYIAMDHSPEQVLSEVDQRLRVNLKQHTQHGVKDGMDVALICIDYDEHVLSFAGAFRPLYMYTKGKFLDIKGDRKPVGYHDYDSSSKEFTLHKIPFAKGDKVYLFSDGYQDQFGGPDRKKIGPGQMKKLIADTQRLGFLEQAGTLDRFFDFWKGNNLQIDDVLVIGIEI